MSVEAYVAGFTVYANFRCRGWYKSTHHQKGTLVVILAIAFTPPLIIAPHHTPQYMACVGEICTMTTIGPSYGRYVPPPAPPAVPPPLTNPDEPHTLDVVIVTASRSRDSTAAIFRQAYGGLTGAQENSRRNEEWAMSSPSQRVEAMGMSAHVLAGEDLGQDGDGYQTLELNETDGWRNPTDSELSQLIGGPYDRQITASTRTTGRGSNLDDYDRALNGLQPRTRWDPETLSPDTLTNIGKPGRGSHPWQRELIGDGLDAMDFARSAVNKAGFGREWGNRANWQIDGNGGIATFKGSDNFQVTLPGSANSNSGVGAVQIKWNGRTVTWHVVNK